MTYFRQLIFFLTFMQPLHAGFRNLILLIDWKNERVSTDLNNEHPIVDSSRSPGFGSIAGSLVTALEQAASPILVSSSLWKNFIERKQIFSDFISLSDQELLKKYKNKYTRFNTDQGISNFRKLCKESVKPNSQFISQLKAKNDPSLQEIKGFIISFATKIDQKEWLFQKITNHWYLLIPKSYLNTVNNEPYPARPSNIPEISDEELQLGLRFVIPLSQPFEPNNHDDSINVNYQDELFQALSKVFIKFENVADPKSEKKSEENASKYLHDWYFYLSGHGGPSSAITQGVISGLYVPNFQKLLTFFNNDIKTDFLFYSTCYAGGEHIKTPYLRDWYYPPLYPLLQTGPRRKAKRADAFNYIIAAETLVYAVTFGWIPSIAVPFRIGKDNIFYKQDFTSFFTEIKKYVHPPKIELEKWLALTKEKKKNLSPSLASILDTITIFLTKKNDKIIIDPKMQIPVIRYPNTGWFSVIDLPQKIFRLTTILAETSAAQEKEIKVIDKEALIVHAESPFTERKVDPDYHSEFLGTLRITKEKSAKSPTVLSNAPGGAVHYFEKIIAPKSGIIEFLQAFIPPINELYPRRYYIKELICKNDIVSEKQNQALQMVMNETITLKDVIILYHDKNPLDKKDTRILDGIFFIHQLVPFYSFWEHADVATTERLKKIEFPGLIKVTEPNFLAPQYPYQLPENRIKAIFDMLKKRKLDEKGRLIYEFIYLRQNLKQLHDLLKKLK